MKSVVGSVLAGVTLAFTLVATSATAAQSGSRVYATTCAGCHESGSIGAPKYGNRSDWRRRVRQSDETLYQHAINGFRRMPARGANPSLSDEEVRNAVDYMVKAVR